MRNLTDKAGADWGIPDQEIVAIFFDGDDAYLHTGDGQTVELTAQQGQALGQALGLVSLVDVKGGAWAIALPQISFTRRATGSEETAIHFGSRLNFMIGSDQVAAIQRPDYGAFRNGMLANPDFMGLGGAAYSHPQTALLFTCLTVAMSQPDNYLHMAAVQSLWNALISALPQPPSEGAIAAWNAMASDAKVRMEFGTDGAIALL